MSEVREHTCEMAVGNHIGHFLDLRAREETVSVYAGRDAVGGNARKRSLAAASAAANVVAVKTIGEGPVTVSVKAVGQFLALLPLVCAGLVGEHYFRVCLALGELVAFVTAVGD